MGVGGDGPTLAVQVDGDGLEEFAADGGCAGGVFDEVEGGVGTVRDAEEEDFSGGAAELVVG